MDKKNNQAIEIGKAYGALARALTEQRNAENIRIAQANFNSNKAQIEAQASQRSADLSRVYQQHVGAVTANAAYRGVGGGSVHALVGDQTAEAVVARKNIDINANNAVGSAAAQAQVPIDDPVLSQIEGTFRGLTIGNDFVEALNNLPPERGSQTSWIKTGMGYQAVNTTTYTAKNFDIRSAFPELDNFLKSTDASTH